MYLNNILIYINNDGDGHIVAVWYYGWVIGLQR